MPRLKVAVCLLLVLAGIAACNSKSKDEVIASDIKAKASTDPTTRDSQIAVNSKSGEVTLLGTTKTLAARQQLEKIAWGEPGVLNVDNQTTVEGQSAAASNPIPNRLVPPAPKPAAEPAPIPPPPPPPRPVVVPAGTVLTIRTTQALSTKTVMVGTAFTGSIMTQITLDGKMVIPAGSEVAGTVTDAKKAGKFKGGAVLALSLHSLTVKGHTYNIVTELFGQESKGKGKRTAVMVGGGAGAGAAIGGIAGGGKGAAIGALAGAAAGTVGAMTGNRDIELPAESALSFALDQPLTLKPDSSS
jgi:hypothetical protein